MNTAPIKTNTHRAAVPLALASAIALALTGAAAAQNQERHGRPFDRAFVASSSTTEVLEAPLSEEGSTSEPVELLRTLIEIRPQDPRELLIQFNGECAALIQASEQEPDDDDTDEPTPEQDGNGEPADAQVTGASVAVWVEIDGQPLALDGHHMSGEDGSVVYCNAGGTADFGSEDPDAIIARLDAAQSTGGFGWPATGVGRGTHEVVVRAALDAQVEFPDDDDDQNGEVEPEQTGDEAPTAAMAVIGKRVLTVELANASIDAVGDTR